jgi:hypothetical protein
MADMVDVSGDARVGACAASAGQRIDVEADVIGAIGVVVQVRGLQDRHVRVAVTVRCIERLGSGALCGKDGRQREHGEDEGGSGQAARREIHGAPSAFVLAPRGARRPRVLGTSTRVNRPPDRSGIMSIDACRPRGRLGAGPVAA